MKKKHKRFKKEGLLKDADIQLWFCIISFVCVLSTGIALFVSHGEILPKIFFVDTYDTGMDFFHSIEYTRGRSPYELFNTLYPPLANLFFYILYRFVPLEESSQWADSFSEGVVARGTAIDLRVRQSTLMLFICFIFLTAVILVILVQYILKHNARSGIVGVFITLTYGVLYSFERGNIVIIAALCCMYFVTFRYSENKIVRESALIALAVGAGLKIYPAVFGIVLLYDKQYAKAVRTVLYGLIAFIAPVFVFHGGLSNISIALHNILQFGEKTEELSSYGYSMAEVLNVIAIIMRDYFGVGIKEGNWLLFAGWMSRIMAIMVLIRGFFFKKEWQKMLVCSLAILLYQSQGFYVLTFMVIPLVYMFMEEEKLHRSNIIPFLAIVFMQVVMPVYDMEANVISLQYLRFQICMLILVIWIFMPEYKQRTREITW